MTRDTSARRSGHARNTANLVLLLHEFDHCPAEYLDASRRTDFAPPPAPTCVWQSVRARRHLSRHILRTLELAPCETRPGALWQVALLRDKRLRGLALHVAAMLCSAQVRHSLLRDEVLAWRDWLTPGPFAFAQRTASLLPVHLAARSPVDRALPAESVGLRWLARAAQAWPEPVARRFLLKMPRADAENPCAADLPAATRLVASVVSTVESQWCSLLATNIH